MRCIPLSLIPCLAAKKRPGCYPRKITMSVIYGPPAECNRPLHSCLYYTWGEKNENFLYHWNHIASAACSHWRPSAACFKQGFKALRSNRKIWSCCCSDCREWALTLCNWLLCISGRPPVWFKDRPVCRKSEALLANLIASMRSAACEPAGDEHGAVCRAGERYNDLILWRFCDSELLCGRPDRGRCNIKTNFPIWKDRKGRDDSWNWTPVIVVAVECLTH